MKLNQAEFFDIHPPLYPWPKLLRREGLSKTYKPREVKFKKILSSLKMAPGRKVLDVGCGEGILLERIVRAYGVEAAGIDISSLSIKRAKVNSSQAIKFLVAEAGDLPFSDGSFDFVLSFDSLEHIENQKKAVLEMARVLKEGGWLLIYTLNKKQKFTWNWCLDKLGVDVYQGYGHDPRLFLDPFQLKKALAGAGLAVKKTELFNSFFTLAADEAMMVLVSLFSKMGLFRKETKLSLALGGIFLTAASFFSSLFLPLLEVLDKPWLKRGYSNSFFLLAQKRRGR